jgi:hypothetical protein
MPYRQCSGPAARITPGSLLPEHCRYGPNVLSTVILRIAFILLAPPRLRRLHASASERAECPYSPVSEPFMQVTRRDPTQHGSWLRFPAFWWRVSTQPEETESQIQGQQRRRQTPAPSPKGMCCGERRIVNTLRGCVKDRSGKVSQHQTGVLLAKVTTYNDIATGKRPPLRFPEPPRLLSWDGGCLPATSLASWKLE